jgi:hypothetical protein
MHPLDLAGEMAASRLRREAATSLAIREARVLAVRCAMRASTKDEEIEAIVLQFYPKLSPEKQSDVVAAVRMRGYRSVPMGDEVDHESHLAGPDPVEAQPDVPAA